jgi:iojap-like ribosome-associated protein
MQTEQLLKLVKDVLDERKALHISILDVRGKTSITDYMVVATATSTRHAKSLCDYVVEKVKENNEVPLGMEGEPSTDHNFSNW